MRDSGKSHLRYRYTTPVFPTFSYGGSTVTPPTFLSRSHGIPIPICVFNRSGWYCVSTPTVSIPELIQLLSGKSMIRYLPPNATAGLATLEVSTPSRLPWPPARSIAIISFLTTVSPLEVYFSKRFLNAYKCVNCTVLNSCSCLL